MPKVKRWEEQAGWESRVTLLLPNGVLACVKNLSDG